MPDAPLTSPTGSLDGDSQISAGLALKNAIPESFTDMMHKSAAQAQGQPQADADDPGPEQPITAPASNVQTTPPGKKLEDAVAKPATEKPTSKYGPPKEDEPLGKSEAQKKADDGLPPRGALKGEAGKHWNAMRDMNSDLKRQLADANLRLEKAVEQAAKGEANEKLLKELELIKSERNQLSEQLKVVAVERHPETKGKFEPVLKTAIAYAKSLVPAEHKEQIEFLLSQPPSPSNQQAILAISEQLPALIASQLGASVMQRDQAYAQLEAMRADASKTLDRYESEYKERMTKEEQRKEQTAKRALAQAQEAWSSFDLFSDKPGDPAHNAEAQAARSEVESLFNGQMSIEEMAQALHWIPYGKKLASQNKAQLSRIAELEKQLSSYQRAEPGGGVQDPGSGHQAEAEAESSLSFGEIIQKRMRQA